MRKTTQYLLYEDSSKTPRQIRSLDCGKSQPYVTKVISTKQDSLQDMCLGGCKLLIASDFNTGICAYNMSTNEFVWKVERREKLKGMEWEICPQSIAVDASGRVLVNDTNNDCVQMFYTLDGRFIRALLSEKKTNWKKCLAFVGVRVNCLLLTIKSKNVVRMEPVLCDHQILRPPLIYGTSVLSCLRPPDY